MDSQQFVNTSKAGPEAEVTLATCLRDSQHCKGFLASFELNFVARNYSCLKQAKQNDFS